MTADTPIKRRPSVSPARRAMLAKVHLAAKELQLAEPAYRAIIHRVTGGAHDSAGACSDAQLDQLLAEFRRMGWKPAKGQAGGKPSGKPHVRKVFALWADMCRAGIPDHPDRAALVAFVKRQTGVDNPEWLTAEQANQVTEGLKAWQRRALQQRKAP